MIVHLVQVIAVDCSCSFPVKLPCYGCYGEMWNCRGNMWQPAKSGPDANALANRINSLVSPLDPTRGMPGGIAPIVHAPATSRSGWLR